MILIHSNRLTRRRGKRRMQRSTFQRSKRENESGIERRSKTRQLKRRKNLRSAKLKSGNRNNSNSLKKRSEKRTRLRIDQNQNSRLLKLFQSQQLHSLTFEGSDLPEWSMVLEAQSLQDFGLLILQNRKKFQLL
jgi:hypothetical protein